MGKDEESVYIVKIVAIFPYYISHDYCITPLAMPKNARFQDNIRQHSKYCYPGVGKSLPLYV